MNNQSDSNQSKVKNIALWVPQVLTAAAFLMAGFAKLSGQPMMVETFDKIGIGQWFRYVTGGIEVASAILLLIPRLTPVGAAILVCAMCGAVPTHLLLIGGSLRAGPGSGLFRRNHFLGPTRSPESVAGKTARLVVPVVIRSLEPSECKVADAILRAGRN